MTRPILFLGGPTASGKTALSLRAAERLGGEIINADSMQVYAGLDLISAQPSEAERAAAPHHLFATLDPARRCSVGQWSRLALACVEAIDERGRTPIFVGGTGLYFKALQEGLAPIPEISAQVHTEVAAIYQAEGLAGLKERASAFDPAGTAKIADGDRQRLMRILAVGLTTGQALSQLQKQTQPLLDPNRIIGVALTPDRETLYVRIEARFDQMVADGVLDEVSQLRSRGLDRALPAMKAVGVPPLLAHLDGTLGLDEAISLAKRDSRRYAKRQFTWFSNQHADWAAISALDPSDQADQLFAQISQIT